MTLAAFFHPLANHLWQSTVFILIAGLLALALKQNSARTRYWIWWLATAKFFIPFSLLVSLGAQLSWRTASGAPEEPSLSTFVIEQVTQPFGSGQAPRISSNAPQKLLADPVEALSALILSGWACGCGLMALRWWRRWHGIHAARRDALRLTEGREYEMLRGLERRIGMHNPVTLGSSAAAIEPFVVGFVRPVLLWPDGLSQRLSSEELEAILLHELSHVRRRDNLTAMLYMAVAAVFWFYPPVWWLGVRLIDERESACDEDVVRWGGVSHVYAEGILKVCEFCVESPVVCAAGVTGSDLKRRIESIMRNRATLRLSLSRLGLLVAAATAAVVGPVLVGAGRPAPQSPPAAKDRFEVVSIRPSTGGPAGRGARGGGPGQRGGGPGLPNSCGGGFQVNPGRLVMNNVTLYRLVTLAYGKHCRLSTEQELLIGGPEWRSSVAYDIQATLPEGSPAYGAQQLAYGEAPQLQLMLQNMLADRFNLALHRDMKEIPVYNLKFLKMGKITLSDDQSPIEPLPSRPLGTPPPDPSAPPPRGSFRVGVDPSAGKVMLFAHAMPMSTLINFIQGGVGRMVVDKTEPEGALYDIPEQTVDVGPFDIGPGAVTVWPEILRQFGMTLEPTKDSVEVLVIDRAERPSEN